MRWEATNAEIGVGFALVSGGRDAAARPILQAALQAGVELDSMPLIIECLALLGAARLERDPAGGTRLLAAAREIARAGGHALDPRYARPLLGAIDQTARGRLADRFEREWEAGRALSVDAAVALALGDA